MVIFSQRNQYVQQYICTILLMFHQHFWMFFLIWWPNRKRRIRSNWLYLACILLFTAWENTRQNSLFAYIFFYELQLTEFRRNMDILEAVVWRCSVKQTSKQTNKKISRKTLPLTSFFSNVGGLVLKLRKIRDAIAVVFSWQEQLFADVLQNRWF